MGNIQRKPSHIELNINFHCVAALTIITIIILQKYNINPVAN
jgi:hypothetical protein